MKQILLAGAVLAVFGVSVTMSVLAQPPGGDRPDGPPPGGDRPDGPQPGLRGEGVRGQEGRPPMPPPLVAALDKNGDREISADEIKDASASLLTLDKNGDGKLTDDEIRPPRPEGFGPDGPPRGGEGFGRGEGPPPGGRDDAGRGEGAPPGGRDGAGRGEGPPPGGREGAGRGEGPPQGGREGFGRGVGVAGRGAMGPPNPERFVEDALRFDADADGKLDKEELTKFATEMGNRQGRPPEGGPGRGGPGGPGGPGGFGRPEGDRPPGDRGDNPEGDRPGRPDAE